MGKRKSIISAFVESNLLKKEEKELPQEQVVEPQQSKKRKVKGFYISPENELKLLEIKKLCLMLGEPKSEYQIINEAIECFYEKLKSRLQAS